MGIQLKIERKAVEKSIAERVRRTQTVLIRQMLYCAEEIVNAARSTDSYKDRTGNLRSSLGCVVAVDGKIVGGYGFEIVLNGKEGAETGRRLAQGIVARFPRGIALIAVAGMNYAVFVSNKGKDVLDSAELLAHNLVPLYLKRLGFLR